MIYKAILKSIEAKESWDNNGDKWTKYIFTFDNGHAPFVFRTDELNYKKGSELEYDLDKNNNKARILQKTLKKIKQRFHIQLQKMMYKNILLDKVV